MSETEQQIQTNEEALPLDTQGTKSSNLNGVAQSQQLNTYHEESKELISLLNFNPQIKAKRFLTR